MDDTTVQKIYNLNSSLTKIESKIYQRAKIENQYAVDKMSNNEDDICDYEIEVEITFFTAEEETCVWSEYIKPHFKFENRVTNINNNENHNVTSAFIKHEELNAQHHCWLLHSLYDDKFLSWDEILALDSVHFDVIVHFQYVCKLK